MSSKLVATVISGRRRVFWLIGLGPILALFGHRFATDPNATMRSVENPAFVAADAAGEFLAKAIVSGEVDERLRPFAVNRFECNRAVVEPGIVLSHFE